MVRDKLRELMGNKFCLLIPLAFCIIKYFFLLTVKIIIDLKKLIYLNLLIEKKRWNKLKKLNKKGEKIYLDKN